MRGVEALVSVFFCFCFSDNSTGYSCLQMGRFCQQALVSSPSSVHATFSSLCARCSLRQPASDSKASRIWKFT